MQPTLRFSCELVGRGSVTASLSDGVNQATLSASYLSDAISDLLWIVISLLNGAQKGQCAWQEEPGKYRWVFSRQEDQLEIRLLWFQDTFSRQPDEEGECRLVLECSLLKFATKLKKQLDKLLALWGDEGYRTTWGYAFPHTEHQKLVRSIQLVKLINKQK